MTLSAVFLDRPFAHRGLHDTANGRAENSPRAFAAAMEGGYGIELDLQLSKDRQAMVFHDYDLKRLTGENGAVAQRTAAELRQIGLLHDGDGIPTLAEVLAQVDGQVPLLLEFKDQDGAMGPNVGVLENAAADLLQSYAGEYAVMSFNPHSVDALKTRLPDVPRGLTTCWYIAEDWPTVPKATRERLRDIPDFGALDACFISHDKSDLENPAVTRLKAAGFPILTWTIKTADQEAAARQIVDNITFEGYLA